MGVVEGNDLGEADSGSGFLRTGGGLDTDPALDTDAALAMMAPNVEPEVFARCR